MILEMGTRIRVNDCEIETLIKIQESYGLFKIENGGLLVRNLLHIRKSEILSVPSPKELNKIT